MARSKKEKVDRAPEPEIVIAEPQELDEPKAKRKYTKRTEKDQAVFGELLTMGINGLVTPLDAYCAIEPAGLSDSEKNNLAFAGNIFYESSDKQRVNQAMGKVSTGLLVAMIAAVFVPRAIMAFHTFRSRQQKAAEG